MKGLRLLLLPAFGFALFVTGLLIAGDHKVTRDALVILSVLITLVFYFITMAHVIKTYSSGDSKKLFWLVAIICLPVIGNIIYIIFLETANKQQEPHGVW
jgi:hypothetical protein